MSDTSPIKAWARAGARLSPWFWGAVAIVGLALIMLAVADARAVRWSEDDLSYSEVRYRRGFRSPPVIHLVTADDSVYMIPRHLWKGRLDDQEMVRRLRAVSTVEARLVGGENRMLYGYPTVVRVALPGITLEVPPRSRVERIVRVLLGPLLLVLGIGGAVLSSKRPRGGRVEGRQAP